MFPFLSSESMTLPAVVAACQSMLKVAHVDGVHPAEIQLIQGFYDASVNGDGWPSFATLLHQSGSEFHVDPAVFADEQEREMVLTLCVMTGFADGAFSDAETAIVRGFADDLGISAEQFDAIANAVKDHLLSQLSHLPDAGSVAKVAKELG